MFKKWQTNSKREVKQIYSNMPIKGYWKIPRNQTKLNSRKNQMKLKIWMIQ